MKANQLMLSALLGLFFSSLVMAKPYSPVLPAQFPLKKIQITISGQSNKQSAESYKILLNGDGNSHFKKNNEVKPLMISSDTFIELLNDFYAMHFFEISDTFSIKKKVILKDNGIVTTIVNKESAVGSKKVCVQLRFYKKCLSVIDKQPQGISQILDKIEALVGATSN